MGKNMKKCMKYMAILVLAALLLCSCGKSAGEGTTAGEKTSATRKETVAETTTEPELKSFYLASEKPSVWLYEEMEVELVIDYEEDGEEGGETATYEPVFETQMVQVLELTRGEQVEYYDEYFNQVVTYSGTDYMPVLYGGRQYFADLDSLETDGNEIVREKTRYVRTPVNVYENCLDSTLAGYALAKEGVCLEITGYDYLKEDGSVNMYSVSFETDEGTAAGWVYAKYLVSTEAEAWSVPDEYYIHRDREFDYDLYGGSPANLDYFAVEKPSFAENELCTEAHAFYLNRAAIDDVESYIEWACEYGANAVVVDIKDGALAYYSDVAEIYNPYANTNYWNEQDFYAGQIQKLKDAGIYTIGRIVVFNDDYYGAEHPEDCIDDDSWPSAYCRDVWEYNINLAIEAAQKMGFNEIQFDYVRFPESSYAMSEGGSDFKNYYGEEKAQAIQTFLYYATDELHKEGVYVSVDVFGECSGEYVTAYGQYYPAISNIVDAISSMPYTDHWGRSVDTWTYPYDIIYEWGQKTYARRCEIPTPAVDRTWITAYDTPYWDPEVTYDSEKIYDQVSALYDVGLTGGFITWNASSSLSKYYQIGDAFAIDYKE